MNQAKRVLITGASSGIGRELVRELARLGHRQVITARRADRLEALADELRKLDAEVHVVPADLADPSTPEKLIKAVNQHLGGLDVLVNNAGYGLPRLFHESTAGEIQHQIDVNLVAPILLARRALPLIEASRGMIINVGSSMSVAAIPAFGVYGMTKAAMAYWNDTLRREFRGRGVKVCLVEPGPIATEFLDVVEQLGGTSQPIWLRRPPAFANGKADDAARRIARLLEHPRRRISMLRRVVWPLRLMGAVVRVFPGLGDAVLKP